MKKTKFLPPLSAIELIWGTTRKFAETSNIDSFDSSIKPFVEELMNKVSKDESEKQYLSQAYTILMASLRNVIIIYKGRQLNYAENKRIRDSYLESIHKEVNISNQVKDILKIIPAITIGGVGGLAIAENTINAPGSAEQALIALLFAGLGYVVQESVSRYFLFNKQMNFIRQDYETTSYYKHYLQRMEEVLLNLLERLEELHEQVFGHKYYNNDLAKDKVKLLLNEIRPVRCPLLDKHMYTRKVRLVRWHMCQTGLPMAKKCKYYIN